MLGGSPKHLKGPPLQKYVNMQGQISKQWEGAYVIQPCPSLSLLNLFIIHKFSDSIYWHPRKQVLSQIPDSEILTHFSSQRPAVEEKAPTHFHDNGTVWLTFPQEMPWLPKQVAPPAVAVAAWVQWNVPPARLQGSSSTTRRGAPAAMSVLPH